jgi:Histidine kinase-, DNA gyrase B-, and HSP90-like ATPase/Morc6 ribosomal protein S5 domain 2-like
MTAIRTKAINILPDRSLMPKIGQTGYSVSQAIAELVDNSIDARLEKKSLTVEIRLDAGKRIVEVIDDGSGMDEEQATNSMKLAHSIKKNKLGEFGLGLKTAATSLGKNFQIITSPIGSAEEYILEYDEEKWLRDGDWTNHQMQIKTGIDKNRSGTTIRIKNLHFTIYPNLPGNIRKDLSTRFAPYIENGEVNIKVNTKWCDPEPLELKTDYCEPDGKESFRFQVESGNEVWGWCGLLKKGSDRGDYGFRVFRRGRLIMQHAKIGFNPHPESRQIIGELHVDHIPVTHNKREFIQESALWQELVKEEGTFWNFMRKIVREARNSMRKTQIDQGIRDKMEVQKDHIMKAIKKIPELKEYAFPEIKEKAKAKKNEHEGIDEVDIEKRDSRDDPRDVVCVVEEEPGNDEWTRKPRRTHARKTYFIWVDGKKFRVEHDFVDLKTDDVLKDKNVDEISGIQVFTNIAFPAFASTRDHIFYATWNIAEAIAEVMVEKNRRAFSEVMKIRDLILKKAAEISRELDEVEKEKKIAERLKKEYEERLARIRQMEESHAELIA